ncbi:MAG: hypothetical protein LBD41_02335 [Clostridiales Family XIII bacterium]|jgi:uncharacterized coiled-coil DUF342 family protein|nr:hypothetical protein [Clostridiales Family XIII bacterium]
MNLQDRIKELAQARKNSALTPEAEASMVSEADDLIKNIKILPKTVAII